MTWPGWSLLSRLWWPLPQLLLSPGALELWPAIPPFLPNNGAAQILWYGLTLPAMPCLLPEPLLCCLCSQSSAHSPPLSSHGCLPSLS